MTTRPIFVQHTTKLLVFLALLALPVASAYAQDHKEGEGSEDHGHEAGGHVELDPEVMKDFGVAIATAGPWRLKFALSLNGRIVPREDRVAHVTPRYPGILREVKKALGDTVAKGEVVAVVESNQSLQLYEVKAQLGGIVVRRHATVGEFVGDSVSIFEVADYTELYADFFVFPADFGKIRLGQKTMVRVPEQTTMVETAISFLSPVTDPDTQSRFVRATLSNPGGAYQPGMFVTADIILDEVAVPLAVDATALRTNEGKAVVFVMDGPHLEPRPVRTGRRDKASAEILTGLSPGDRYAVGNTFVLQAELEKGEAEHEH